MSSWKHIKGLQLADPKHYLSGEIDLLLGAEKYAEIIESGLLKGPPNTPFAQQTKFGWMLSGPCAPYPPEEPINCDLAAEESTMSEDIQRPLPLRKTRQRHR